MCLRCGAVEDPYRSWPPGPAGPGDYGSPPDASPPEYDAAPTGGFFAIGARGRDYRMATGWWDRGRAVGGTSSPGCASSASHRSLTNGRSCPGAGTGCAGLPRPSPRPSVVDEWRGIL